MNELDQSTPGTPARNTTGSTPASSPSWLELESAHTRLPVWLLKELRRAGADAATVSGLDEQTALDLVAEIRAEELE
jgi:hypothetical protein